jgi:hypothetical protein
MLDSRRPQSAASKLATTAVLATAFALAAPAEAQAAPSPANTVKGKGGDTGIGMTLGSPLGFSLKHFMNTKSALQWNLSWGILHHGNFRTDLSYLWHPAAIAKSSVVDLVPYLGAGMGFGIWSWGRGWGYHGHGHGDGRDTAFGILFRLPVLGLGLHWQTLPIDTVLEGGWTPMIEISRDWSAFGANHGDIFLGIRYYF